jgi:hypothetical protein
MLMSFFRWEEFILGVFSLEIALYGRPELTNNFGFGLIVSF